MKIRKLLLICAMTVFLSGCSGGEETLGSFHAKEKSFMT